MTGKYDNIIHEATERKIAFLAPLLPCFREMTPWLRQKLVPMRLFLL